MKNANLTLNAKTLTLPVVVLAAFWALAVFAWQASGYIQPLILFGYIGTAVGGGLGLYNALPKKKKPIGRRVALTLVGLMLIVFVAVMGSENIQFEGFWFGLFTGFAQAAVMHYLIAKVFGPLLFGRLWCGWACWTVMVLDLLPFQRSSGRLPRKYEWIRYLHAGLSIGIVAVLVFVFGYEGGITGTSGITWFVVGNLGYYALGIGLAYALKDNRAFCKYVCPVSTILKITSRFSLLKIKGDATNCTDCLACEAICPMDIQVNRYTQQNTRVLSTECSLCQTCISACAQDALKISFGFDIGGEEFLRRRA
ncbi:MAG TPA: 4Fe-4S binding protein [Anaerolineales bacterium]|nr:4Fe-4S binding protein [Anaerolineales bacterium]